MLIRSLHVNLTLRIIFVYHADDSITLFTNPDSGFNDFFVQLIYILSNFRELLKLMGIRIQLAHKAINIICMEDLMILSQRVCLLLRLADECQYLV